ncbi:hypothetical protein VTN77DRAFT_7264 [Rasamsonia byssochlamydoides]|uniref:uncharacterized protein n=1 Tax=Rasamsonia byssochlamydoides TaxID=89139 RepID=UPI0037433E7D
MTIAVLTPSTTRTTRREPLKAINMATSQAQSRPASSSAQDTGGKGRGRRTSARLNAAKDDGGDEGKTVNRTAQEKASLASEKKRKAAYDEDIEGFQFTRTSSKKAKPLSGEEVSVPEPIVEETPQQSPAKRGRPPKTKSSKASGGEDTGTNGTATGKPSRGRPKRASLELQNEPEKNHRSTRARDEEDPFPMEKVRKKGRPSKSKTVDANGFLSPEPTQTETSKIALPFADTPVIQRNKEMRKERAGKGERRSSLGMRGRRASSLIDSGASNAVPHKEVDTSDFYKHIASEGLSEPRRMKQLLTWCATRALGEKPSGSRSADDSARLAARVIQEELLQDFANRSELSDWFTREDSDPPAVVVKKPNPKNIQNADKIKELEEQIQRLQNERHALNALLRPPSIPHYESSERRAEETEAQSSEAQSSSDALSQGPEAIDTSVLDPSQQSLITSLGLDNLRIDDNHQQESPSLPSATTTTTTSLPPISPATVSSRLSRITTSLAPTLDSFASGIHDIEIYRSAADNVSSKILRICSQRLEERDLRNTLRALEIEEDQDDSGGGGDKNLTRIRLEKQRREDIGLVLGALSRVERR